MLLGSHMKDPSQCDLQRVGLKSLVLVTGRCSGLDFRGIPVEKGVGFEHLSPIASHSMGLDSSDLIRGPLRSYPSYPTVGFFCDMHVLLGCFHPWSLSFQRQDESPFPDSLTFSFILACVRCPSSTCRVNLYKTDICPISLIPELLGMVDKAEEYGSVRCRALKGNESNFPRIFLDFLSSLALYQFYPFFFFSGILDLPRTELSSAVSQSCFVLYIVELGPQLSSAWVFGLSTGKWAWPINYWAPQQPLKTLLSDFLVGKEGFGKPEPSIWLI